jgi:hypothetical protein
MRMIKMQFYSQTLEDIPKEFLSYQKKGTRNDSQESTQSKTEDLLFIITLLLFLQDEPYFYDPK